MTPGQIENNFQYFLKSLKIKFIFNYNNILALESH